MFGIVGLFSSNGWCITGGPGAAHEVEQFAWYDHVVIPIKSTGGAAGGKFKVPDKIFEVSNCAFLQTVLHFIWFVLV